jgi:hypothetical protein
MVDALLTACREQDVRLAWQAGRCQVSLLKADPPDQLEVPVQKSVFRAALARVAALCNERIPNSVSPYGGLGEVTVGADPAKVIRVKFVNTPEEQILELAPVPVDDPTFPSHAISTPEHDRTLERRTSGRCRTRRRT